MLDISGPKDGSKWGGNESKDSSSLPTLTPTQISIIGEDPAKFVISQLILTTDINSVSEFELIVAEESPELIELFKKVLSSLDFLGMIKVDGDKIIKSPNFHMHSQNSTELNRYLPEVFKIQTHATLKKYIGVNEKIEGSLVKYRSFSVNDETVKKIDQKTREYIQEVDSLLQDAFDSDTNSTKLYFLGTVLDEVKVGEFK